MDFLAGLILKVIVAIACIIVAVWYRSWYKKHLTNRRCCTSDAVLNGKTVVITGANSGIGKATALDLARRGARVILACRNLQKAEDVAKDIKNSTGNSEVVVRHLDLSSLQSVREFAQQIIETEDTLDILINNAGVGYVPPGTVTQENVDYVFGTNHFGHFLLTNLLLDLLKKSALKRVVTVSSCVHFESPKPNMIREDSAVGSFLYPHLRKYHSSKLANALFARELARREASSGVVSVSLHPGAVFTPIWEKSLGKWSTKSRTMYYVLSPFLSWMLLIDETAGAQTTLHCALDESVAQLSGKYFDNCAECEPSTFAQDDKLAEELWTVSCEATGLKC